MRSQITAATSTRSCCCCQMGLLMTFRRRSNSCRLLSLDLDSSSLLSSYSLDFEAASSSFDGFFVISRGRARKERTCKLSLKLGKDFPITKVFPDSKLIFGG